jgi:hypothetical protein
MGVERKRCCVDAFEIWVVMERRWSETTDGGSSIDPRKKDARSTFLGGFSKKKKALLLMSHLWDTQIIGTDSA